MVRADNESVQSRKLCCSFELEFTASKAALIANSSADNTEKLEGNGILRVSLFIVKAQPTWFLDLDPSVYITAKSKYFPNSSRKAPQITEFGKSLASSHIEKSTLTLKVDHGGSTGSELEGKKEDLLSAIM